MDKLKFTDHKIQNELILLLQQQMLRTITDKIRKAQYSSVMIDETRDVARHEQVWLVVRYTDEQYNVHETFLGFERTAQMTGEALYVLLAEWIRKLGLKLERLVGQCYDGASAMRGDYKGVATRLKEVAPLGKF